MKYALLFLVQFSFAQQLNLLYQHPDSASFRGMSVVDKDTFWVSGSKGVYGVTKDGGKKFQWFQPKGYENNEFRDIDAVSKKELYIMAITEPAEILYSNKNGKNPKAVYKDSDGFFDAIDCNNTSCLGIGDATEIGQFYLFQGIKNNWSLKPNPFQVKDGEAFFAASGSNIFLLSDTNYLVVSGGYNSRLFYEYKGFEGVIQLPLLQGTESSGANGMDFNPLSEKGVIVGGNFKTPNNSYGNMILFHWNNQQNRFDFEEATTPPKGYKSSVVMLTDDTFVSVGITGVDISLDGGMNWEHISDESYHVVQKRNNQSAYLAGSQGKIALLKLP